jgi:hypothetical protein
MKRGNKGKKPFLWPPPKRVKWLRGCFSGWPPWQMMADGGRTREWPIKYLPTPALAAGGYTLEIRPKVMLVRHADGDGRNYGAATLTQIWSQCGDELPCVQIEDAPDMAVRGFMLDISRGKVPSTQALRRLIRQLVAGKFNHLQLYMEHTYAFRARRRIWAKSSPLTAKELLELQAQCRAGGIELSANFNSFGHFERWLKHPAYKHLAECPDGFEHPIKGKVPHGTTLKPNAASLRFLDKLWAEYLPLFKSKRFNLGGDEPWELGQGWSKPLVKKYGKHQVYLDFLKKLHKQAKKYGKEMLFWGDILLESPELVKEVPKDATALLWGYEADHPFAEQCAKLAKAKREFWVCPGTSAWNTFTGRTDNMLANIESASKHGLANGAEGMLLTSWGDGGNHQPWPLMYPGLVYAAGMAWNAKGTKRVDLARAVNQVVFNGRELALAKALIAAGRIEAPLNEGLRNATRLHRWFFAANKEIRQEAQKFPPKTIATVEAKLRKLALKLGNNKREFWQNYNSRQELKLGLDMAAWAAQRAQLLREGKSTRGLKVNLNKLIKGFRALWSAQARPGGLQEAVARMRAVEKEL